MKRNYSLDLLRIIAMIMIIILHLLGKGQALNCNNEITKNFSWLLEALCIVSVNVYVLISGYFLYESKFKFKKVIKLWSAVLFYSFLFLIIFKFLNVSVGNKELLFSIFPVLTKNNYWFITCYILMYIFSPYLNVLLTNISKKSHFNLCCILFLLFCVISVFLPHESMIDSTGGYSIVWFITIYIFAVYIKKYDFKITKNNKCNLVFYVIFCLVSFFMYLIFTYVGMPYFERFYFYNSIFVVISSVFIFIYFKNLNINNKKFQKIIYFFSPLTLGVYLIHENILLRQFLYNGIFHTANYANYNLLLFLLIIFGLAITIFISCAFIEYLRIKLFDIVQRNRLFRKFDDYIINVIKKIGKFLYRFLGLNEK